MLKYRKKMARIRMGSPSIQPPSFLFVSKPDMHAAGEINRLKVNKHCITAYKACVHQVFYIDWFSGDYNLTQSYESVHLGENVIIHAAARSA